MIVPIQLPGPSKIALQVHANYSESAATVCALRHGLRRARLPVRQAVGGMP